MENIYLIYDLTIAVIIAVSAAVGAKKGFLKTVMYTAVYLAALIGSRIISEKFADTVYEQYARPYIVSAIETEMTEYGQRLKEKAEEISGEALPEGNNYREEFEKYLTNTEISDKLRIAAENIFEDFFERPESTLPRFISDKISARVFDDSLLTDISSGDYGGAAEIIEEKAVRRAAVRMTGYIIMSLSFSVIMFAGHIIVRLVLSVRTFRTVRQADNFLGGVLGFITGYVIVIPIVIILKIAVSLSGSDMLSEDIVSRTYLFRFFYNIINIGG